MMLARRDKLSYAFLLYDLVEGPTYNFHNACLVSNGDEEDGGVFGGEEQLFEFDF